MGEEKYSGLIAGQKFTGRTEIRPMDREARGGLLHGFRMWCQLSSKMSVYRSSRSGGVLHVSWTCSQTFGARGAAAHASGAMRSDTRATTNLNLIGWPVGLSFPTFGVGRPSVVFLFDCWSVGRPMLMTIRECSK
ncbi:hypothetical protein IGI04_016753, partial [Brassica rapa subsp. trilocularis]